MANMINIPESAFLFSGSIDEVLEKAKKSRNIRRINFKNNDS